MFKVRFSTKEEGLREGLEWEPRDGDGFECSKREALRRFRHLVDAGRKQERVDGDVPFFVELVTDEGQLRLGTSGEDWGDFFGPWADIVRDDFVWPVEPIESDTEMA